MYKSRYDFVIYSFFQNRGDIFGFYENSELYIVFSKNKNKNKKKSVWDYPFLQNYEYNIFFP